MAQEPQSTVKEYSPDELRALLGQHSAASDNTQTASPDDRSGLERFANTVGFETDPNAPLEHFKQHPVADTTRAIAGPAGQMAEGLWNGGKRIAHEIGGGIESAKEGNMPGVAEHAMAAIPFVGSGLREGAEAMPATSPYESQFSRFTKALTKPEVLGSAVRTAGEVAPMVEGGLQVLNPGRTAMDALHIPRKSNAAPVFNSLNTDLAKTPVNLSARTLDPLQRTIEIGERGGTTPTPIAKFLQRTQAIEPMTFPEARDYQSNLADLSREEVGKMNRKMSGQVGQVNKGFYGDIQDAANQTGRGPEYAQAMKEYRRANQLQNIFKNTAKVAIPAAGGGAIAKYIYDRATK